MRHKAQQIRTHLGKNPAVFMLLKAYRVTKMYLDHASDARVLHHCFLSSFRKINLKVQYRL
jgi:hypothetical protein